MTKNANMEPQLTKDGLIKLFFEVA